MDLNAWLLATWIDTQHGAEAPKVVHSRIMSLRRDLADDGEIALWLSVDDAVHQWAKARTTLH